MGAKEQVEKLWDCELREMPEQCLVGYVAVRNGEIKAAVDLRESGLKHFNSEATFWMHFADFITLFSTRWKLGSPVVVVFVGPSWVAWVEMAKIKDAGMDWVEVEGEEAPAVFIPQNLFTFKNLED